MKFQEKLYRKQITTKHGMNTTVTSTVPLKLDGTPDRRYRQQTAAIPGQIQSNELRIVILGNNLSFMQGTKLITRTNLQLSHSNISCGVMQLSGVSTLSRAISGPVTRQILIDGLRTIIANAKSSNRKAFLISSNNNNNAISNSIMDELALSHTDWKKNPNSGSMIKVWVL